MQGEVLEKMRTSHAQCKPCNSEGTQPSAMLAAKRHMSAGPNKSAQSSLSS